MRAAAVLCALVLLACTPQGITQEQAVDLAMREFGSAATHVEWVRHGQLAQFSSSAAATESPDRPVWAIRLAGSSALLLLGPPS